MPSLSPEQIVDIVLNRRPVYDLDTDSHIRQVANRLTARALFEMLARADSSSPDFEAQLSEILGQFPEEDPTCLISFGSSTTLTFDEASGEVAPDEVPGEHYLQLVFRDEQAAYYQFHVFPDLEVDFICGASRKRTGAVQHVRLELSHPEALQDFIESCRANPHLLRVEESTEEEFHRAPSHGV